MEQDSQTAEIEELRRELDYMRRLTEGCNAQRLANDIRTIAVRYELEQKRNGFRLMAELAIAFNKKTDKQSIFSSISKRLNSFLNMQRTIVLLPDGVGVFKAAILHGYPPEEREDMEKCHIPVDKELLDPQHPVLVTGADPATRFKALRETLRLPYFIAMPVFIRHEVAVLLITGRIHEQQPYLPRLGWNDVETMQTVSAYVAAILANQRLHQAENLAKLDPLTELLNLRGITEQLQHVLALARQDGFFAAVMFVDLDCFKTINDTHGHIVGDLILQIVAKRITSCVRKSDFVGRIGGDEFVILLSHINQPANAALVAQKITDLLGLQINVRNSSCKINVSASIGIAVFPDHGNDETALIHAADKAMYSVKRSGKNAYAFAERPFPLSP
ncbi:MAG: sensor domain-containing diguanylate cyclase [Azoarcus sp.]|nr:sensor domain-containing diguanylate cyclase [Azoarcus sp.]